MKTTKYILIALIAFTTISFSSCKKYLDDVSENLNEPGVVGPKLLLPNVEVATFASYTGNNARRAGVLTQHLSGTGFQMQDVANYYILETDVINDWITTYTGALVNAQIIIDKFGAANPHYGGIAKVLKAMNLGLATDMWGDIPNKDALKGVDGNITPRYDTQESIYADIQSTLSSAIVDLQKPLSANTLFPASEDYMFQGNTQAWIRIAFVLKARYANRLSKRSPGQSADDALAYLNAAYSEGMASNADDAMAIFGGAGSDNNQWYDFNNSRADYIKMGKFFIDTLVASADPRLPLYADAVDTTYYEGGAVSDAIATTSSDIGAYIDDPSKSLALVTFVEAKFIEAECQLRKGNGVAAASAYNEAVKASLLAVTSAPDAAYEAIYASETNATISLNKIMMQKYIALFSQVETWTDWRRTGIPSLTPNTATGAVPGIPRILPTSIEERTNNPNAIVVGNILTHTWFDM